MMVNATSTVHASEAQPPARIIPPLWILWAGLLFGGMALGGLEQLEGTPFGVTTRLTSSLALVMAGFAFVACVATGSPARWPVLAIAIGMLFGFLGDVSNARIILTDLKMATLGGIVTFAIGHLFYMAACLAVRRRLRLDNAFLWWGSILVWQIIGIVGWYWVVYPVEPRSVEHWAALPYSMLLAGTAGMTTGLVVQDRRFWLIALGGAFFLASDLVLAFQLFRSDVNIGQAITQLLGLAATPEQQSLISRHIVWCLYGPAQMMIVYASSSVIAALNRGPQSMKS